MNYGNIAVKKMNFNGQKVKKWYHNGVKVFSSGNIVTYNVDTGTSYQEEVDSEATVLSPKTFTPTKSGWTFVGWREDTTASSSVLQSKTMGDDPITLYAVFKRTFSLSFVNNYASGGSMSPIYGDQYYNNGNVVNPQVTLPNDGYSRSGISFVKWVLGAPGTKVTLTGNTSTRAVCKYPDTIPTFGVWGAGIIRGNNAYIVDGTKYSQISGNFYTSKGNVYVDKYGTHSNYTEWIGSDIDPTGWQQKLSYFLFYACSGVYSGYAKKYINGISYSDGSTSLSSSFSVNLPTNNVYVGAFYWDDDDSNSQGYITDIKLIGRTVQ